MAKNQSEDTATAMVELTPSQREQAMSRFEVLRPHIEEEIPVASVARNAGVACGLFSVGCPDTATQELPVWRDQRDLTLATES